MKRGGKTITVAIDHPVAHPPLLPPPIPSFPPPSPLLIHTTQNQPKNNPKQQVYNPANCETVELLFECKKIARVVGGLARIKPQSGTPVR